MLEVESNFFMSKRAYKRVGVGELDYAAPLVFEEAKPVPGKGGKAFKSLTAAVKAAEREKEEARGYKVACEVVLEEGLRKLAEVSAMWRAERRAAVRLCVWMWGAAVLGMLSVIYGFFF